MNDEAERTLHSYGLYTVEMGCWVLLINSLWVENCSLSFRITGQEEQK